MPLETKEEITKHLNTYKAGIIKDLSYSLADIILLNPDFWLALKIEEPGTDTPYDDDVRLIIEDYTGRRPDIERADIISPEDVRLLKSLTVIEGTKRVTKASRIDVISSMLCSDALLEGLLLMLNISDGSRADLAEILGCPGRFAAVYSDPVFQNRKVYKARLNEYIFAAVNLYGCIHVSELLKLIRGYERKWFKNGGRTDLYTRETGSYRKTFVFTPEWLGNYMLQKFAESCTGGIGVTLDGLLLHGCFIEELMEEDEQFEEEMQLLGRMPDEEEFAYFIDDISYDMSYRIMYDIAAEKEMYRPKKMEFLSYAAEENVFDRDTLDRIYDFLKGKYFYAFEARAQVLDEVRLEKEPDNEDEPISGDEVLDDFMIMLEGIVGNDADCLDRDPTDMIHGLPGLLDEFDIAFDSDDDINELVGLVMTLSNRTRLWLNHGYTPEECAGRMPVTPAATPGKPPVIVAGSSEAARMLAEGREEIEKMGFTLDLDSNADEIPVFAMPEGAGGQVRRTVKKVYPNDPCPCGSGKKYKKCCGRAKG